jgi:hypothetical protein
VYLSKKKHAIIDDYSWLNDSVMLGLNSKTATFRAIWRVHIATFNHLNQSGQGFFDYRNDFFCGNQ